MDHMSEAATRHNVYPETRTSLNTREPCCFSKKDKKTQT